MIEVSRRAILSGIGSLLAAPAVVRADSLMKVRGIVMPGFVPMFRDLHLVVPARSRLIFVSTQTIVWTSVRRPHTDCGFFDIAPTEQTT